MRIYIIIYRFNHLIIQNLICISHPCANIKNFYIRTLFSLSEIEVLKFSVLIPYVIFLS
jgi:hypothetical protein